MSNNEHLFRIKNAAANLASMCWMPQSTRRPKAEIEEHAEALVNELAEAHAQITAWQGEAADHEAAVNSLTVELMEARGKADLYRETIEDMARQFAYPTVKDGVACLTTGGLSALEGAFHDLGWEDPHPVPEQACQAEGCAAWATCGTPTPDGYKRLCYEHWREIDVTDRSEHAPEAVGSPESDGRGAYRENGR